jgi:hypothetical protein
MAEKLADFRGSHRWFGLEIPLSELLDDKCKLDGASSSKADSCPI